jgi:hypothetical protein
MPSNKTVIAETGWLRIWRPMVGLQFELFRGYVLASWVIGAHMECKLFVTLQLDVAHHFIERCAGEGTRRFEPPATFGATKTPKMLLLNPYQLPAHGLCRCAPTLPGSDAGCSFAVRGRSVLLSQAAA